MNRYVKWLGAWTTLLVVSLSLVSCEKDLRYIDRLADANLFNDAMQELSDVIVYDIFSPVVASRVYVYPTVAAYAVMQQANPQKYASLAGQLNGYTDVPTMPQGVNANLAAVHAFLVIGKKLIFSENKIDDYREGLYAELDDLGMPKAAFEASIAYGEVVADHVLKWADDDFYKQTRTFPKYTIQEGDQFWKPTPPAYMEGIEPHWNRIRPMVLPSARMFNPEPPYPVDMTPGSDFYQELMEVFEKGAKVTEDNSESEEAQIAAFWDCNPYVMHTKGHAMFATKKITPGGHWIGITKLATQISGDSFDEAINTYLHVTVALFDGFISCWDTKWETLVVRPETIINQYLDEDWQPKLQTPPFPEYTSGHSVISRSAATVLTKIYGDNFAFDDTTEEAYGLPTRSYTSFMQASDEAAVSRLYGGIHYRRAIEQGVAQGAAVGQFIAERLNTAQPENEVSSR
jgi:hypothetical protein